MRYPADATFCFVDGSDLEALPDPRIGSLLAGRYVLEEVIGEGGMASVYRARHKLFDRPVAIKIMNPMLATDAIVRERFRREAKSAQKLTHPNIIEINDQGDTEDGTCYIVMELLTGESLASVIERGPVELARALHVMSQMARGIARAHDLGVIHRDIKPENIFLVRRDDGSDLVKLLDFGIARSRQDSRLTDQGELFGTPQYMSPERIMGQDSGESSDLYALGVVFFEMLAGMLPFYAEDIAKYFNKHMHETPRLLRTIDPRIPVALEDLVARMLGKQPKDRPVDAHRVHQDLLEIIKDLQVAAPPATVDEALITSAPVTLAPGPADIWARRVFVLDQMLTHAYGPRQSAPEDLTALLMNVRDNVRQVVTLRNEALDAQKELEEIESRGREKRTQLGFAVDQLGVDASRAKDEVRSSKEKQESAALASTVARERFASAHRDAMTWEGRSGFLEPSSDLADAYRTLADCVDEWQAFRQEELRAQQAAESAERLTSDLDFQIRELRAALQKHEQALDSAREACEEKIRAHGKAADRIETELVDLTARFCTPLRARPELAPLFKELETDAAA